MIPTPMGEKYKISKVFILSTKHNIALQVTVLSMLSNWMHEIQNVERICIWFLNTFDIL